MSILDIIAKRHSYRGKYQPVPVSREHLTAIMQAGLDAPSGCNKQTTSLIAVDDPALLSQMNSLLRIPAGETVPAYICVLTQRVIAYADKCFAVQDYSAAIENMLLAIVALGYESCWYEGRVTGDDNLGGQIARILGVPEEYELVCVLPVGVAENAPAGPAKLPFEERAWFNTFPQKQD